MVEFCPSWAAPLLRFKAAILLKWWQNLLIFISCRVRKGWSETKIRRVGEGE